MYNIFLAQEDKLKSSLVVGVYRLSNSTMLENFAYELLMF